MFLRLAKKGKNDLGSYVLGIFIIILAYFLGQIPITVAMMLRISNGELNQAAMAEFQQTKDFSVFEFDSNLLLILLLLIYVVALFGLWLVIKYIHKKPFLAIITARSRLDWSRLAFAFSVWMGLGILGELISYLLHPELYSFQGFDGSFLLLILIALLILPIQTSFEEIFFRGYLLQGFSLPSHSRAVPLILSSVLFGLVHFMNPEVGEFGLLNMMIYYIGVGLFLGIITLLDDGLELALGIHAATNIFGAVIVTYEASALQTKALFKLSEVQVELMNVIFFVMAAIFISICYKKYGWSTLKKVYGSVSLEDEV